MPRVRSRSPDYQRKWYWYQDPATGWWSWHYHALDWTPKVQGGAASSTSMDTVMETAQSGSEGGQPKMNESKEKEAVVDMNESKEKEAVVDMKESKEKQAVVDMDVDG